MKRARSGLLVILWSTISTSFPAIAQQWVQLDGLAHDVGVGADGSVWVVGANVAEDGFGLWRRVGSAWTAMPGAGVRIAVGPDGNAWTVDKGRRLLRFDGSGWVQLRSAGTTNDVGVGTDGTAWVIGNTAVPGGFDILRSTDRGVTWTPVAGGATDITVDAHDNAWVVNSNHYISRFDGNAFVTVAGRARDIAVASNGDAWIVGDNPVGSDFDIARSRDLGTTWERYPGAAVRIAADASGKPWAVNAAGQIFRWDEPLIVVQTPTINVQPPVPDLSAGPIVLPGIGTVPVQPPGTTPPTSGPDTSPPLTVGGLPFTWPPVPDGLPKGGGQLVCSTALGINPCGTTQADSVGAYSLNTSCKNGFYDPIHGGTCWKCPDDTDDGGGWIRAANKITDPDACWRVPKESTTSAIRGKKTSWAWECKSPSFWDGYDWGACWTCPDDHPRRTAKAVWSRDACATPVNQTRPAIFLTFNGCPKPEAATMGLKGKRLPGKPFLDIAGGWNEGNASGACYACPVTDEDGNILITQRNSKPIYGVNQGCDVLFKWKPNAFPEPGLSGLVGVKAFIKETQLLDSATLTAALYELAKSRDLGKGTPAARDWVVSQWQAIANNPYANEQLRTLVFAKLMEAVAIEPAKRTAAQTTLINSFQNYIQARRTYLAEMGLAMYDAWKNYDDSAKLSVKQSTLQQAFDYGTVPLDFHGTLGSVAALGGTGLGLGGTIAAAQAFAAQVDVEFVFSQGSTTAGTWTASNQTSLYGLTSRGFQALNILKGTPAANAALGGAMAIALVGAVIQSVAIDQFIAIQTARPNLEAALAEAKRPVDLGELGSQPNGSDLTVYYWAKAMEASPEHEDSEVVAWAAAARRQAQASDYALVPTPPQTGSTPSTTPPRPKPTGTATTK